MDEATRKRMASSKSPHWCTPQVFIDCVEKINSIALDPCSNSYSIVPAKRSVTLPENGLEVDWKAACADGGLVYVNPPYGKASKPWTQKCVLESARDTEIIELVASRTETKFVQDWIFATAQAVCFWKGRITFIDGTGGDRKNPAFFPSLVAYWGPNVDKFEEVFSEKGKVFRCLAKNS